LLIQILLIHLIIFLLPPLLLLAVAIAQLPLLPLSHDFEQLLLLRAARVYFISVFLSEFDFKVADLGLNWLFFNCPSFTHGHFEFALCHCVIADGLSGLGGRSHRRKFCISLLCLLVKFRPVVNRQEVIEGFCLEAHLANIRVLAIATFETLAQTLLRILG
jgi:hypothetical protein